MVASKGKGKTKQEKYYKELTASILNDEYCVHILLGDAGKAHRVLSKRYPDMFGVETLKSGRGYSFTYAETDPSIWTGLEPGDPHFYATLSHEAVHAIDHIFSMIQEKEAPEIYAHSVAAVIAKVEQWVKRQAGKKR